MTKHSLPFWKEYPERDNEWVRQYPTKHVAIREEDVFTQSPMGIYVHIPFCNRLCFSCPYIKHQTDSGITQRFLDALKLEISNYARRPYIKDHRITLGYIGGGTPTSFSSKQLAEMLDHLFGELNMSPDVELSIETTPVDINEKKARTLVEKGVRRISLGVQTFVKQELEDIGRPGDPQLIMDAIKLVQDAGFKNVNIDLMHGLNGQTMESWEYSLDKAIELGVTCVSFYTYMEFAQVSTKRRKLPPVPSKDVVDEMFLFAARKLTQNGFEGYYGDCFAKPGFQPRYGHLSWSEDIPIIPLGPTATGHLRKHWYFNEPNIDRYIDIVNSGRLPISMGQHISKEEAIRRAMVLGVKASRVDRKRFKELHGVDFATLFKREIEDLQEKGLVTMTEHGLEVTGPKGWYFLDNISKAFYSDEFKRFPQHLGADITPFLKNVAAR
ncbi:coproporphyrinogen III oxidase family protein [Myxococcus stipitatus]|uniref:coproporphyrinogen-III oxidase family protein n=1 Tax=Myxococcus stipitatus TaxID=83455 RepID=UPI001F25B5B3|nr:coproporphyrinogen-III oxidase family protein [Myxococcus stipitatus]MCE9669684.1 coproporphyrinogen III oxidase family protein [Myxococcus stipitatus]